MHEWVGVDRQRVVGVVAGVAGDVNSTVLVVAVQVVGGPVQLFPPIFFGGAGDLIFRSIKTPQKTDRR